jgi:hypothetical protein
VGIALLSACSFDTSGGGGGSDGGGPPPREDAAGGGDAAPGDDGGGGCTTGALDFAPDQWVEVADDSLDLTEELTVEAWALPREVDAEYHIISRHADRESEGYVLMIKDGLPEFRVYYPDDSGPPTRCSCKYTGEEDLALAPDEWVHVAGSFSDGTSYLFANGELIETCTCQDLCGDGCTGAFAGFAGPLTIGIEASRLDRFAADGLIDDVHVRSVAQTASFDPGAAAGCAADTLLLFQLEAPIGQEVASGCGAAATGRLGSEAGADLNDPSAVEADCPPK